MSTTTAAPPRFTVNSVTLDAPRLRLTDEQFFMFCQDNRDLRFEITAGGVFGVAGEGFGRACARRVRAKAGRDLAKSVVGFLFR